MAEKGWTARQLAAHLKITPATISSVMRLLEAPAPVQARLQAGEINQSEAIAAVRTLRPKCPTAGSVLGRKGTRGTKQSFTASNGCRVEIQHRKKIETPAVCEALLEIAGLLEDGLGSSGLGLGAEFQPGSHEQRSKTSSPGVTP